MLHTQITPLRSTVGRAIRVDGIRIIDSHPEVLSATVKDVAVFSSYLNAETKDYSAFFPENVRVVPGTNTYPPAAGVGTFVSPLRDERDFSFAQNSSAAFLAVLLKPGAKVDPRNLFIEVELTIDARYLIGGICYYGYPFTPAIIDAHGESSSNHGLPREISISCENGGGGFIDNESVLTLEEPISHSGAHFLAIEPVKTGKLKIRFSDWPSFIVSVAVNQGQKAVFGSAYGLIIPAIIPYELEESTNYDPKVPYGVLACIKPGLKDFDYFAYSEGTRAPQERLHEADYFYLVDKPDPRYMNFTAASITGQKRRFKGRGFNVAEDFISTPLRGDEHIDLFLEQSEENNRCISGFELTLGTGEVPAGTTAAQAVGVSVYEIDLPDGVSPVSVTDEPDKHKYFTPLYSGAFSTGKDVKFTGRFTRPSLARFFLFRMENKTAAVRQIKISALQLIQSAHVSVTSRASRVQTIDNVNIRLIGKSIADDYAKLGEDGLAITVELLNASKKKSVVFSANNLLTLLGNGNAHIYSNHRRQEIVKDVADELLITRAGSHDIHSTAMSSLGWRRNESGRGVGGDWQKALADENHPLKFTKEDKAASDGLSGDFESFGTSETRTHNEQIGLEALGELAGGIESFLDLIYGGRENYPSFIRTELIDRPQLLRFDDNNFDWESKIWDRGFFNSRNKLYVGLTTNLSLPPSLSTGLFTLKTELENILRWINGCMHSGQLTVPSGPELTSVMELLSATPFALLNGLSFGINGGASLYVGGGISASWSQITPTLGHSTAKGTSGSIAKQANKAGYNYAQSLNAMFDKARAVTIFEESRTKRTVERTPDQKNTVRERKRGWEIAWQNKYVDIVTCKIPLGIKLPASARKYHENIDQTVRVRFGGNLMDGDVEADVWFDVSEETIKEDY